MGIFERSELLLGEKSTEILGNKKVAVIGIGGVGSYVLEGLVRSGIGEFLLVDNDTVNESNINRQLIATMDTIGLKKTDVAKERCQKINPNVKIQTLDTFVLKDNIQSLNLQNFDFIVDAIDTVSAKIALAEFCFENKIDIISAMGTGNKLSPLHFEICDIFDTKVDPLAKVMRRELKKRGIERLNVCYSTEEYLRREGSLNEDGSHTRPVTASLPFVPSVCGLYISYFVVKKLLGKDFPQI